jgi:hypothetical protein
MTDLFSRIRLLSMSDDLKLALREAHTTLIAAGEQLTTSERALAALPGSAWERASSRPTPREIAGLRSDRRRLVDAMGRNLEKLYAGLRTIRMTTALAVVREGNFDAAAPLFEVEEDWRRLGRIHSGCVDGERALLPLDAMLKALDPEERARVISTTQAIRSSLTRVRPQIAILSDLPDGERADLADNLRDELVRAEGLQGVVEEVAMRHPGDYAPALVALRFVNNTDEDEGDGTDERGLAQQAWEAVSSLFSRRPVEICRVLVAIHSAWATEIYAMRDSISYYLGNVDNQRVEGQGAELFSLDRSRRRRGGPN